MHDAFITRDNCSGTTFDDDWSSANSYDFSQLLKVITILEAIVGNRVRNYKVMSNNLRKTAVLKKNIWTVNQSETAKGFTNKFWEP